MAPKKHDGDCGGGDGGGGDGGGGSGGGGGSSYDVNGNCGMIKMVIVIIMT